MYNFGDDFIFGGATAAYQAEGGAKMMEEDHVYGMSI